MTSLRIDVLTVFPELITSFCSKAIVGRAQRNDLVEIRAHDIRDGATDAHRSVDDTPFGGGPGMVLAPEPIFRVVDAVEPIRPIFFLGPAGERFNQARAVEMSQLDGFTLLWGRYEGIDQRVIDHLCSGGISLGDFVLGGGEVAALAVIEAVTRLVPGVMGNEESQATESFADGLLEYPQYTRPATVRGMSVPEVLLSGDHGRIAQWRRAASLALTKSVRPDLIEARGGPTPPPGVSFSRPAGKMPHLVEGKVD